MMPRARAAGLTLVEMLVALVLFALVALASFTTLDAIIRVRDRAEGRLEQIARYDRTLQLYSRDLIQSPPGAVSGAPDSLTIASDDRLTLTWALQDDGLTRTADGRTEIVQTLLPIIGDVQFRYLDERRSWSDVWPAATNGVVLLAVEMTIILDDSGDTLRRLAEVPLPVPEEIPFDVLFGTAMPPSEGVISDAAPPESD